MKVTLGANPRTTVIDFLTSQNVPFKIDPAQPDDIATVQYDDQTYYLFMVLWPDDVDSVIMDAFDKLRSSNMVILYGVETGENLDFYSYRKVEAAKSLVIAFNGYCPKSALELGSFLKDQYCNCHTGCSRKCKECATYPATMLENASKEQEQAYHDFARSMPYSRKFSFCE